jgi:hypothetical protein
MTKEQKTDYIITTIEALKQLIPKDSDDCQLHQLSARANLALSFLTELN